MKIGIKGGWNKKEQAGILQVSQERKIRMTRMTNMTRKIMGRKIRLSVKSVMECPGHQTTTARIHEA